MDKDKKEKFNCKKGINEYIKCINSEVYHPDIPSECDIILDDFVRLCEVKNNIKLLDKRLKISDENKN